ncbi:hypothetical protein MJ575_23595 [Klebsiella pneumoniae]|nr:hypothetical protein MJ575_23595 [Klebsiella pneumoniae]
MKNSRSLGGQAASSLRKRWSTPQADGSVCAMKSTAEGPKRMDCASGFGAATMVTTDLRLRRGVACPEEDAGESAA